MPASKTNRKKSPSPRKRPSRKGRLSPRAKAGPVNEWFELRRSEIQGWGAFAIQPIPKGTRIIEYAGERINNAEADRRYDDEGMTRHHTFLFVLNSRTCID